MIEKRKKKKWLLKTKDVFRLKITETMAVVRS